MSMRHRLIAGLLIGFALTGPLRADPVADGIAVIPGVVEDVRVGGTWVAGDHSGIYRLVVARSGGDAITARLFVQWVAFDDQGGARVRNSLEIKEFSDLAVDIDDFTSESDGDGLVVFIRTIDPNGSDDLAYELFVFSPTDYRFGQATN